VARQLQAQRAQLPITIGKYKQCDREIACLLINQLFILNSS
jgi:hypothetical protein